MITPIIEKVPIIRNSPIKKGLVNLRVGILAIFYAGLNINTHKNRIVIAAMTNLDLTG